MNRKKQPFLIAAVAATALAALACNSSSPTQPGEVAFHTLLLSQYSGIDEPRDEIIGSTERFREVWNGLAGNADAGPPPAIDFRNESVALAAFGGGDGCAKIEVRSVDAVAGGILVRVVKSVAGPNCVCTQQYTTAIHVVAFTRAPGVPTRTVREQEVFACG